MAEKLPAATPTGVEPERLGVLRAELVVWVVGEEGGYEAGGFSAGSGVCLEGGGPVAGEEGGQVGDGGWGGHG